MDDLLLDTIKEQGGNGGVDGMLKPADMERLELQSHNVEEAQRLQQEEEDRKKKEAGEGGGDQQPTIDLDALELKVKNGEELTAEEAQLLAKIDDKIKEADPVEVKYTIDGKEFTADEINTEMRQAYGIGDVKISDEGLKKMRETYVDQKNKAAANSTIDRGYKENARQREENARLTEQNLMEKARLEAERNNLIRSHKETQEDIKQLKIIASSPITVTDVYEMVTDPETQQKYQRVNPEKMDQYNEKIAAQKELKRLETRVTSIASEVESNSQQQLQNEVRGFIAAHAEYNTSEPLNVVADKMKSGQTVNPDDRRIMIEIYTLLNDRSTMRLPLEEIYEYRKSQGTLAVKPKAQPGNNGRKPDLPNIPSNAEALSAKIKALREKQKRNPASIGGGGQGDRGLQNEKRESLKLVEEERAMRGLKKDPILQEMGYQK